MRYLLFALLTIAPPSYCYIHSMVKLWDINNQNQSRIIDLWGDWHEEHPANQSQFSCLEKILERKKSEHHKPLYVLVEDPVLPGELFLNRLATYGKQSGASAKVTVENVETRAAPTALAWLLGSDDPWSDQIRSRRAYDKDSEYALHDLTFQDISIAFDMRKQQIKDMCTRLNYSTFHFNSELHQAQSSFNRVQTNLKKWNVEKHEPVVNFARAWLKGKLSTRREYVKDQIIQSFTSLSDIYTTLRIKTISHDYDVLLCTGSHHTWFVTSMLQKLGAWHIDQYQNGLVLQGQPVISEKRLQTIHEPTYSQRSKIWLAALAHYCIGTIIKNRTWL